MRHGLMLLVGAMLWEALARWHDNDRLLPGCLQTLRALAEGLRSGELLVNARLSLGLLLPGYLLGVSAALVMSLLAASTRLGRDLLATLTAMFNPLPAMALLPLSVLWFGLGTGSLVFVLTHAALWPMAQATHAGFEAVPETLRIAGRHRGLRWVRLIVEPPALPAILSGLRSGWAFAWRTLIAAELVSGATTGRGGLGWTIVLNSNELRIDRAFAGLLVLILIGLAVERLLFNTLERVMLRRWGLPS